MKNIYFLSVLHTVLHSADHLEGKTSKTEVKGARGFSVRTGFDEERSCFDLVMDVGFTFQY